jgi:hypothetical protein
MSYLHPIYQEPQPGTNPLAIAYVWLKAQPEYAEAVDS